MALIAFKDVSKAHDATIIFEDVTFEVNPGERVGVVGPNGSGKSTLCSLLNGAADADTGDVMRSRSATVGYLAQHNHFEATRTVLEEGMRAFEDVFELEADMRRLEAELAETMDDSVMARKLDRLAALQEKFDEHGGYGIRARVESVLMGLGLRRELLERPVSQLSGGESGRLALGKLLLREPDLMILDEPTNHLDIAGCEWLESYLEKFRGACMIVSHDRFFLDRVTRRTLEVAAGGVADYSCGYSEYEVRKAEERDRARKVWGEQQDFIRKEREFIRKHMGTQRTKEAKGRLRRLTRLELCEPPRSADQEIKLSLAPKKRLGTEIVDFHDLCAGYDGRALIQDLNLRLEGGDRLGIVGANGAGKSTLLKILMGNLEPLGGEVVIGKTAELAYFDQLQASINESMSPWEEIAAADLQLTDLEIRSFLARFLFNEDDVHRPLSSFSGGEKSKLMLAKMILARPNLLVLDEPTNHLDIPSRKALEAVLDDYPGVIITVSHDRYFLDRVCNRILWLNEAGHDLATGDFSSVRRKRADRHRLQQEEADAAAQRRRETEKKQNVAKDKERRAMKVAQRSLERIENEIMATEAEKEEILRLMQDPDAYRDPDRMKQLKSALETAGNKLVELEAEWEQYI